MKIKEITRFLEQLAPSAYQESYDNSGLIVGDPQQEVTGVLVSLDTTEAVVEEAIAKGCNLIVSHHPIVFKGLKSLTGKNYVERTVLKAIKNEVALYAIHTNLDNVAGGVNFKIAERLGLEDVEILAPKQDTLYKLVVYVPTEATGKLLDALYDSGVGQMGNYAECSFRVLGTGTFKPLAGANPHIGEPGRREEVAENRIEVIFPAYKKAAVLAAMRAGHPYEEVAFNLMPLANHNQEVGSGVVGNLPAALAATEVLAHIKNRMDATVIRHTALVKDPVRRVAVCGGAGSFLLPKAIAAKADLYLSSDFKYHEFFDAENHLIIADIGHFESEQFTKELLHDKISKKFTNFATHLSEVATNPVSYYF